MKKCSKCKLDKNIEEFNIRRSSASGRQSCCKECNKINLKSHYNTNKKYYYDRNDKQSVRLRSLIAEAKNKPCTDCGIRYPHFVMQFDHLSDKTFTISGSYNKKGINQIMAEIEKCEVVCANCHAYRTNSRIALLAGATTL